MNTHHAPRPTALSAGTSDLPRTRQPSGVLSPAAFRLLGRIHVLTDGRQQTTSGLRDAVAQLTAAADPGRAARLRPGPGESPALVARLAVWALRQVDDEPVNRAARTLDAARDDALEDLLSVGCEETCGCS